MAFTYDITSITRSDLTINVEILYEWPERSYSERRVFNFHDGTDGVNFSDTGASKRQAIRTFAKNLGARIKLAVDTASDLDPLVADASALV